jgi:hypothetical protein
VGEIGRLSMQEIKEFMDIINKALPGAWEATIRQMYIYGVMYIVAAMITGIGSTLLLIRMWSLPEDEVTAESIIIMLILGVVAIVTVVIGILFLINPEYHAIQSFKP